jgi:hypothetical protein
VLKAVAGENCCFSDIPRTYYRFSRPIMFRMTM